MKLKALIVLGLATAGLFAQEPSLIFQVKFLRILMSSTGQYGIACPDAAMKAKLESTGINIAPTWKLALANTEEEVRAMKKAGKLVVVTNPAWLSIGGGIAVTDVDGKPQIRLNNANIKASGVVLSDTIIKMGNGNS